MPGVPSSRACDGCRKQKKKCDTLVPPCPRCKRLQIECMNLGQRRYKFHNANEKLKVKEDSDSRASSSSLATTSSGYWTVSPSRSLGDGLTRLTSEFIEKIHPDLDMRYQLRYSFGDYLEEIPYRLGTSDALDTAADLLVYAHNRLCRGYLEADTELLRKNARALNVLRHELDDPMKAYSSETLCAIMLLMICQTMTSLCPRDTWVSHGRGAARIWQSRGYKGPQTAFESKMLLSLRGSVVGEALLNSKVQLSQEEWNDLVETGHDDTSFDGQMVRCFGRLPDLMSRCKAALQSKSDHEVSLLLLQQELWSRREKSNVIIQGLRDRSNAVEACMTSGLPGNARPSDITYLHCIRVYGLALMTGIVLNTFLISCGSDGVTDLREESALMAIEVLRLARLLTNYRPLGSISMILCLGVAWVALRDAEGEKDVRELLVEYVKVLPMGGMRIVELTSDDLSFLVKRFTLVN